MATFMSMPKLGLDMTSGVIVHWLVAEGTHVREGQPILEIETDKATQELTAPVEGILGRILQPEGTEVPCGENISVFLVAGEAMPVLDSVTKPSKQETQRTLPPAPKPEVTQAERVFVSPVAKRRAAELGIDLATVSPRNGKIGLEEVEEASRQIQAGEENKAIPTAERNEMSTTRRKIAEHMSQSARTVARVGLTLEADATALMGWREKFLSEGKQVSFNVLLASLAGCAIREHSYLNTRLEGQEIVTLTEINIGIAVDTPKGLVAPVLRLVDKKDIPSLQVEFDSLTERAIAGQSRLEDLQGGTFTISNLGSQEIETFLPVINYPECAILGVGAILKKPVVVDDQVVIRPRMGLTLAFDHRLVDGTPAAAFLRRLKQLVEKAGN